jgi:hypothetical protein
MDEALIQEQELQLQKTGRYYKHIFWLCVPVLCMACYFYGWRPLLLCGIALLTGNLCDRLVALLRRRVYTNKDLSNESFALIIALLMPATVDIYVLVVAVLAGVLIGKEVFGGYGSYPFNPAAVGYAVAAVSWPEQVVRYPQPYTPLPLRVIVGLDIFRHLVKGAGKVCHFALALHALHAHREVAAAKALGGIRHLLQRVGELAHQQAGQHAGAQQHDAGGHEEVRPELLLEGGKLRAGGAQKQPAAELIPVVNGLHHRDIAFFGQSAAKVGKSVVVAGVRVGNGVGALADIQRHGDGGKFFQIGGDEHIALPVGKKEIGLGAFANDLQLGVQRVQLRALRHGLAVYQVLCGALGNVYHLIQRFVAFLREIAFEQHPLRAAHQHDAQHHQGGHQREKGRGDTFTHY